MNNLRKTYLLLMLFYMGLIFYLSSISIPGLIENSNFTKFCLHFFEFSLLGFLAFKSASNYKLSFLIGTLYGISDEIHQYFVPLRVFDIFDIFADSLGSLIGSLVAYKLTKQKMIR